MVIVFDVVELILLVLPAYISNSVPVIFGGGKTIESLLREKNVFGKSKTIQGFASGVAFGTLAGVVLSLVLGSYYLKELDLGAKIVFTTALAFGAMLGDLVGSFIKRRLGIPSGKPSPFLDQIPFLFMALFFGWLVSPIVWQKLWWQGFVFLIILTYVLHFLFNLLAHRLRLKKVPW